jgi:hypothetical protein
VVTASPVVVRTNQAITFDASGSYDYQTPAASLQVSWDLQGASTALPTYPTAAAPWTAWTTTKTVSNTFTTAGTYTVRVAVADADGDVGYGSVTVIVSAGTVCTVTTNADVDDGATNCTGPYGTDGQLSLAEAIRLAPNNATITFSGPMTVTGTSALLLDSKNVTLIAPAGTVLDRKTITLGGGPGNTTLRVVGLAFTNQTTPITVANKTSLTLEDCTLSNSAGITDNGTLSLLRTRMTGCTGSCVAVTDATGADTLRATYSSFEGGVVGVDFAQCATNKQALAAQSNVFAGLQTAIRMSATCTGWSSAVHNTFAGNGTGISYSAGTAHVLRNNVFTGHTVAAVALGTATFASRDRHLLYQNASDGGLAGDPATISGQSPLYQFPANGDYRVQLGSPAIDSAVNLNLWLLAQYPGAGPQFLGAGPDRGGRESW